MTHAAARHRELDRRAAQALGLPAGHALVPSRLRMSDMKTMQPSQARVLLAELTECVSGRGNRYLKGWLGASSLVAFEGDGSQIFRAVPHDYFGTNLSAGDPVVADRLVRHVEGFAWLP